MKLTEKTQVLFEAWYLKWIREQRQDYYKFSDAVVLRKFYREVDVMKWGVYQEFFVTHKLLINTTISFSKSHPHCGKIYEDINDTSQFNLDLRFNVVFKTMEDARIKVIKKANEIINNN